LTRKQPVNALAKINQSLSRLGHAVVAALPEVRGDERKKSLGDVFSPALIGVTVIVTASYFLHIVTFYFLLKWAPKLVADMGFAASQGGRVLTVANFGGATGGAIFGLLTARFGLKPLTIVILALNAVAVAIFGRSAADLNSLMILGFIVNFFGNAAVSGLYSIAAYAFPTHVRATGTGFVIGVGRGGAVLSPWLAGYLLNQGATLPTVGMVMGVGSLLAACILTFLRLGSAQPVLKGKKAAA
jgi:MFS family permease